MYPYANVPIIMWHVAIIQLIGTFFKLAHY